MPLTPSKTRELLESLGHRPRKPLGQNFLIDGNIVRKSLQLAGLRPGEQVVEIGPGLGTLTEAMLRQGCLVNAVEIDSRLADYLQATLAGEFGESFKLVQGDALAHPRADISDTIKSFKVVANLPYAITTPWLEALLENPLPSDMVLMMQKEAADRITAQPGTKSFGAISIFVSAAFNRAGIHHVSRSCFYPVPGVDSLLLHLRLKPSPVLLRRQTRALIRRLFTQRRKQIGSLLSDMPHLKGWLENLPTYNCTRASRAEAIPLDAWLCMDAELADLQH